MSRLQSSQSNSKYSYAVAGPYNPRPRVIDPAIVPAARKGLSSPWAVSSHETTTSFSTEHREKYLVLVEDDSGSACLDEGGLDRKPSANVDRHFNKTGKARVEGSSARKTGVVQTGGCLSLATRTHSPDSLLGLGGMGGVDRPCSVQLGVDCLHAGELSGSRGLAPVWKEEEAGSLVESGDLVDTGKVASNAIAAPVEREGATAPASGKGSGRGTPRSGKRGGCTPRGTKATISAPGAGAGRGRTGSSSPSIGKITPRGDTPRAPASARHAGPYQPAKGAGGSGAGGCRVQPPSNRGQATRNVAQHASGTGPLVAGAGPASPAKGNGDVLKGDEGTWSPFFCNQWYALRDKKFSDEISKYMALFRTGVIAKYDMLSSPKTSPRPRARKGDIARCNQPGTAAAAADNCAEDRKAGNGAGSARRQGAASSVAKHAKDEVGSSGCPVSEGPQGPKVASAESPDGSSRSVRAAGKPDTAKSGRRAPIKAFKGIGEGGGEVSSEQMESGRTRQRRVPEQPNSAHSHASQTCPAARVRKSARGASVQVSPGAAEGDTASWGTRVSCSGREAHGSAAVAARATAADATSLVSQVAAASRMHLEKLAYRDQPPAGLARVLQPVCILLGERPEWASAKGLLQDRGGSLPLLDLITGFDQSAVSAETAERAAAFLDDGEASLQSLRARLDENRNSVENVDAGAGGQAEEGYASREEGAGLRLAYALCCWYQAVLAVRGSEAASVGQASAAAAASSVTKTGRIPVVAAEERDGAPPAQSSDAIEGASSSPESTAAAALATASAPSKARSLGASCAGSPLPSTAPPAAAPARERSGSPVVVPAGYRVFQPRRATACDPKLYLGMPLSVLGQIPAAGQTSSDMAGRQNFTVRRG